MSTKREKWNTIGTVAAALFAGFALYLELEGRWKKHPAQFESTGNRIELRDQFGSIIDSRRFGEEGWAATVSVQEPSDDWRADKFAFLTNLIQTRLKNLASL